MEYDFKVYEARIEKEYREWISRILKPGIEFAPVAAWFKFDMMVKGYEYDEQTRIWNAVV